MVIGLATSRLAAACAKLSRDQPSPIWGMHPMVRPEIEAGFLVVMRPHGMHMQRPIPGWRICQRLAATTAVSQRGRLHHDKGVVPALMRRG